MGHHRGPDDLHRFVRRWNGRFMDDNPPGDPNPAGGQCVNVANAWLVYRGFEPVPGNAVDFAGQLQGRRGGAGFLQWHPNGPSNVPARGSLVVFSGPETAQVGHISVFLFGDVFEFLSFDEDWPVGAPCGKVHHDYGSVLGWQELIPD